MHITCSLILLLQISSNLLFFFRYNSFLLELRDCLHPTLPFPSALDFYLEFLLVDHFDKYKLKIEYLVYC